MRGNGGSANYCGNCGTAQETYVSKDGYVRADKFCMGCGVQLWGEPEDGPLAKIFNTVVSILQWGAVGFLIVAGLELLISWCQ